MYHSPAAFEGRSRAPTWAAGIRHAAQAQLVDARHAVAESKREASPGCLLSPHPRDAPHTLLQGSSRPVGAGGIASPKILPPQTPGRVRVPLRSPQAAAAEEVADGAGSRELGVAGVENHAEIFGDDSGLGAVLHLQQGGERGEQRGISAGQEGRGKPQGAKHQPWFALQLRGEGSLPRCTRKG